MRSFILKILCLALFHPLFAYGQQGQLLRLEFEVEDESASYRVFPWGNKGALLYHPVKDAKNKVNIWIFEFYNTVLQKEWKTEARIPYGFHNRMIDSDSNHIYLYFEALKRKKNDVEFRVLVLNLQSSKVEIKKGKINKNINFTNFKVSYPYCFLGGREMPTSAQSTLQTVLTFTLIPAITGTNVMKYHAGLYHFNLQNENIQNLTPELEPQAHVRQIAMNKRESLVMIKQHISRQINKMYCYEYSASGDLKKSFLISNPEQNRKLNTIKYTETESEERFFIGTYNNNVKGKPANPAFSGFNEPSSGIYICAFNADTQQYLKFYNFSEFQSFFRFLNMKASMKLKKRAARLQAKGKEIHFNYQLLIHEPIVRDSTVIFMAEAYYPEYRTEVYTSYDFYGRPVTQTYTVFEGYRYTNALAAAFNREGNIVWQNSFEIMDVLSFQLRPKVKVLFDGDDILMAYSHEGSIAYKIIRGNEVLGNKEESGIETGKKQDRLISDENSDLAFWYENYFISYGYQKIKNPQAKIRKRKVFYINKIGFQ